MLHNRSELLHLVITFMVARSFIDRPIGSNSTEHQLVVVN
jgi:hypothetical protein